MGQNLGPPQTNLPCPDENKGRTPFAKTRLGKTLKEVNANDAPQATQHTPTHRRRNLYIKKMQTPDQPRRGQMLMASSREEPMLERENKKLSQRDTQPQKEKVDALMPSPASLSPSGRRVHQSTHTSQPLIRCCPFWRFSISSQCL